MEVTIKYTHEDEDAYMDALNGWKYRAILSDVMALVRSHDKGWIETEFTTDAVRELIVEKLAQHAINL